MVEAGSDRTGAKAVVGKWAGKRDQHCGLRTAPRTLVPSGLRSCCRPHRLAAESGCLRPVASTAWLSRQPEEGQARLQAVDLDRHGTRSLPGVPGQAEPLHCSWVAPHDVPLDAVVPVAELARHAKRGGVVLESPGDSVVCSEAFEG